MIRTRQHSVRDSLSGLPGRMVATGVMLLVTLLAGVGSAQELQPRRWSHLPTGSNFAGGAYAFTWGDIAFDPVLEIENGTVEMQTVGVQYIRTFEMFGRSARFDLLQAYQEGRWKGLLEGVPASTRRTGLSDTVLRLSMNLIGAPPLEGKEFADYRKAHGNGETIVGVGLALHLPTGDYQEERLLNLGTNRFTIRPQVGVTHQCGKWTTELTGSMWIFTENDEFWDGNRLEQDPLYTLQGHVVYTIRPGLWVGGGLAYGYGGESTVNGGGKGDSKGNLLWGVSVGVPINREWGFKVGYVGMRTQRDTGADIDTVTAGFSCMW